MTEPDIPRDPDGAIRYERGDTLAQAQAKGRAARAAGVEDIPPSTYRADQKKGWRVGWTLADAALRKAAVAPASEDRR